MGIKMGSGFLEILKEVTIFMLAGQMLVHLLPTAEYGKYVRVILGIMLLSRLALPILSLTDSGAEQLFSDALSRYAQEMERIEKQVSSMGLVDGDYVQDGLTETVRQSLASYAESRNVRITGAAADAEGRLIITVAGPEEKTAGEIRIEPIEVVTDEDTQDGSIRDGDITEEDRERAEKTESLRNLFADVLEMDKEKLEVIWDA